MQWRRFDQAEVPTDTVFLLNVGEDIFFARATGKRIVVKSAYADAVNFNPEEHPYAGSEIEVFLHRNKARGTFPMWAHFHKPQLLK